MSELKKMYKAQPNSPEAILTADISASDTTITVSDAGVFAELELPNELTLGRGDAAETVQVTAISGNALTVVRGFEHEAIGWPAGTILSRNMTAYDLNTIHENIETVNNEAAQNTAARHTHPNKSILDTILQAVVDKWNAAYAHISDAEKHITAAERTSWNGKANKSEIPTSLPANGGNANTANSANSVPWTGVTGVPSQIKGFNGYVTIGQRLGTVLGRGATAEGSANISSGEYAHSGGYASEATGECSFAFGMSTEASGLHSIALGEDTTAIGRNSFAGGRNSTAGTGNKSPSEEFAFGSNATASGGLSVAFGSGTTASGHMSTAFGFRTTASGMLSFASGSDTTANAYQFVIGVGNVEKTGGDGSSGDRFIVGKGTDAARANAFRVASDGHVFGCYGYASTGADYAELFEWEDGNPDNEDRRGLFVFLRGEKICIANGNDDEYILGIVSANPAILGDAYDDQWQGMYEKDIFGETVWHEQVIPAYTDDAGVFHEETQFVTEKINANYHPSQEYIPRTKRKEWGQIGLYGKLVLVDDGTCEVNGYCKPSAEGKATASERGYRVMSRLDETHIKVLIK